jgi:chaperonin GroES
MNIKPLGPWVVVRVSPPNRETAAGLFLPEGNMMERLGHNTGVIEAVGTGTLTEKGMRVPLPLKVGDTVLFRGYLAELLRPDYSDPSRCMLHSKDIVGVVEQ